MVTDVQGKNVVVVGMARSGAAAVQLLLEKGAHVRAVDQNPAGEVSGVRIEQQTGAAFEYADLVVISPGVPAGIELLENLRARGVAVIGELELASWFLQGPILGITGSNGKTTTTALTGHILRECGIPSQVGGNIGTAPSAIVASSRPDEWNVLELSSFQLETIETFHARIGAILNITPDHLDRHFTLENYAAAKRRLLDTQTDEDYAVLNADDPICVAFASETLSNVLWFSSTRAVAPGVFFANDSLHFDGTPFLSVKDIPLRGRHNVENTMAAAACARLAGAELDKIAAAVRTFSGVEHRLEFVRDLGGVAYYNDSKATNVDATLKAIDAFDGGLWIILGGKDKNSDYTVLQAPLHQKANAALLIGAAAPIITEHLGNSVPLLQCGTLDAAIRQAHASAKPGDTVLLAPACASFDQFQNFEQRGRIFKELVSQLDARESAWRA